MAQKRINDLTLRSDFDETCNFPTDDLVQSWRVTGAQMLAFMESDIEIARANLLAGAVGRLAVETVTSSGSVDGTKDLILVNATSGAVTLALPAVASHTGRVIKIKKIAGANNVILDGNSTETIDGQTTQTITDIYQSLSIVSTGTEWSIV